MKTDKELKKEFKQIASKNPDKYYATAVLKKKGFNRQQCSKCKTWFWTKQKSDICGDPECQEGFTFFGDTPAKAKLDYVGVWKNYADYFKKKGYTIMNRYPVVARWNPTTYFTIASIAAFQPYVISGEVEAPAKELVIPQFCIRFGDLDNVGITGSHCTGFVMIGQHAFVSKKEWDQERYFKDLLAWIVDHLGIPEEELFLHEDSWAGGGNYGPCMEFFSRGCELCNQVYMMYEHQEEGDKELKLKVLDMGLGHERVAWFLKGEGQIYESIFPTVCEKLKEITSIAYDETFMNKYLKYAPLLNLDEVSDINKAWEIVGKKIGVSSSVLKEKISPLAALYSIAEHARTLLVALGDGALPSNVGGGYNLRVIFKRAQGFIDKYEWNIDLGEVCRWHAEYLKSLFPELLEKIENVKKILEVERRKYYETKKKNKRVIEQEVKKKITTDRLIQLYDSYGISPGDIDEAMKQEGKVLSIPDNFYGLVAERHEQAEHKAQTKKEKKFPLEGVPLTKILYYGKFDFSEFTAKVVKIIENMAVLDESAFYPTSGGQLHDIGNINEYHVVDVIKQNGIILHVLDKEPSFNIGETVNCSIDMKRRMQLTQHHTAAHIINGAAKEVLGDHVWQAGAAKTLEKGRLDITHFDALTAEEEKAIERIANNMVEKNIEIGKGVHTKADAEQEHGFRLYQGGAVPGSELRVVDIPGFDTEACGGTHVDSTNQVGRIKILKSSKVQDGIVRIEFAAGEAADKVEEMKTGNAEEIASFLDVDVKEVPARAREIFEKWKKIKKLMKKKKEMPENIFDFSSSEKSDGDVVAESAKILKTQPEHVLKTLKRFLNDIEEWKK